MVGFISVILLFVFDLILLFFCFIYFGLITFYDCILFLRFGRSNSLLCCFIGCFIFCHIHLQFTIIYLQVILHYFMYNLGTLQSMLFWGKKNFPLSFKVLLAVLRIKLLGDTLTVIKNKV